MKELESSRVITLQQLIHQNHMEAAGRQRSYHDAYTRYHVIAVNDTVWLYKQETIGKEVASKLKYIWC